MQFFVGLHQPHDARHFKHCFISVNRIRKRKSPFVVRDWILDSAAFTELSKYGKYRTDPSEYASQIRKWSGNGNLLAAVTQDYMCEPFILEITGKTVGEHQKLTIERYDALLSCGTNGVYLMPVLQGFTPCNYVQHLETYGDRLKRKMWVGVGSICKRNGNPKAIAEILMAIRNKRPDLRLHGFGLKTTSLSNEMVSGLLYTADSMAWSFAARRTGRDPNDWRAAAEFIKRIEARIWMTFRPKGFDGRLLRMSKDLNHFSLED